MAWNKLMFDLPQVALDLIGSGLTGVNAMCIFTLHVFTNPKRTHWVSLPNHIRLGMFWMGLFLMLRSVNLTSIAESPTMYGHMNAESIVVSISMMFVFVSLAVLVLSHTFPPRVWERLRYVTDLAKCSRYKDPIKTAALVEMDHQGALVIPPGGGLKSFVEAVDQHTPRVNRRDVPPEIER